MYYHVLVRDINIIIILQDNVLLIVMDIFNLKEHKNVEMIVVLINNMLFLNLV